MKCRLKYKNKAKLKGVEASKTNFVATIAVQMGMHRSSVYCLGMQKTKLEGDKKNGSKFYVNSKAHEAKRMWCLGFLNMFQK
ncbi:hypothetical protein L917_10108 [Phytophthora nicotianae]|uniref:Uncharacterized protein n=1 Tax=Phytophthora nicotianae TaxID=4792 RepID=W2L3C5_PHYNI|nr:hypothetical protein L917_10108 [Phytophthora nicotianae]